jgi:hypothetical protein
MVLRNQHYSARHIARNLHRSASTITRANSSALPLDRTVLLPCLYGNVPSMPVLQVCLLAPRGQRFKARRCSKLAVDTMLFGEVHHFLSER